MSWFCPYCRAAQVVTKDNSSGTAGHFVLQETALGDLSFWARAISCLNPECRQPTVTFSLNKRAVKGGNWVLGDVIHMWSLLPESSAKPQPDFIPIAIREDYFEACKIRDLSPKASATLARRCLQGMIRDFCGIAKSRLVDEIIELREQLDQHRAAKGVTHESVDAIDSVRSVGNIGAHMEKDVDLIVDIDPGEAQMLIELIEMLFDEWYVEREKRAKRLAEITALSAQKASELADAKLAKTSASLPAEPNGK
jgi:hypothetical protein